MKVTIHPVIIKVLLSHDPLALWEEVFVYVDFTFVKKESIFPLADTLFCPL